MKHHIAFKFLAILLCTVSLLAGVASAVAVYVLGEYNLYSRTMDEFLEERTEYDCNNAAAIVASRYASRVLGNCPEALLDAYFPESRYYRTTTNEGPWYYTLEDAKGKVLESTYANQAGFQARQFVIECQYIAVVDQALLAVRDTAPTFGTESSEARMETDPTANSEPEMALPDAEEALDFNFFEYYDPDLDDYREVELGYYESPRYTITLYVTRDSFVPSPYWNVMELLWTNRFNMILLLSASLLVFAGCAVYLCCAAGRKPGSGEVRPEGLNRIPLDLYAFFDFWIVLLLLFFLHELESVLYLSDSFNLGPIVLAALCAFGISLVIVTFLYACAAQFKARNGFWWRHSAIAWALGLCWKILKEFYHGLKRAFRWLRTAVPPRAKKAWNGLVRLWGLLWAGLAGLARDGWQLLRRGFTWLGRQSKRIYTLLPLSYQWLLTGAAMVVILFFSARMGMRGQDGLCLLGIGICLAVVLYGVRAFGTLLESAKRMSQGDLETKVDSKYLVGSFEEFAEDLNALADVAVVAAQKQMKSERMKAELVTNVSHDIKTPLTSIINYVDLLQKAKTQEEAEQYLEVLARQSQRMKKLIEDLVEMSKATTGNLNVDIRQVDAVEAVNQALGEFADKLAAAQLTPIFKQPEAPVSILADGRLAWRVLSNLLSNAVKYALPGTRLYVDLVALEGKVLISLKNISREQLNISPDELTERFVRGDASRNTEGSGLGLNIAKSLMELQHGQLQLLVDGDLFKVTLVFPAGQK